MNVYLGQLKENLKLTKYSERDIEIVQNIPLGSLKRIVSKFPKPFKKRYKGNADIYKEIAIIANFGRYAYEKPGYVEVDFVEHNGGCSSGTYAVSVCYVDIYSQWISRARVQKVMSRVLCNF